MIKLILIRLFSKWVFIKYRKQLNIDKSTHLNSSFLINFYVKPDNRVYVYSGSRGILNAKIIFESKNGLVEIGDRVYIGGCTIICREGVCIGNDVTIAWGVTIYDHNSHSLDWRKRSKVVRHFYDHYGSPTCYEALDWGDVLSSKIVIEDKVWIGFDVVLLKGVRVGEGAVIAARSVVSKDVAPYTLVAGNPAVFVRHIDR